LRFLVQDRNSMIDLRMSLVRSISFSHFCAISTQKIINSVFDKVSAGQDKIRKKLSYRYCNTGTRCSAFQSTCRCHQGQDIARECQSSS
jgi:hypothetical protein